LVRLAFIGGGPWYDRLDAAHRYQGFDDLRWLDSGEPVKKAVSLEILPF
jgi:hypothetical protein